MAISAARQSIALLLENRNHRMSGSLDLSKTKLQGFDFGVSGESVNQSGSGIHQLFRTVSDYPSCALGIVFRGLDLVGRSIDFSALSDSKTESVLVFVCAECCFVWNRIVRIMGL